MNALHRRFGKKGLSIVGVTDGDEERTFPWIERLGARHPWARNTGMFALRNGIRDYPKALLVAPDGVVVWTGHPASLDEEVLTKNLEGSLDIPLWNWPAELNDVRTAIATRRWGAALTAAGKLAREKGDLAPWRDRTVALVETLLSGVERTFKGGDVLGAWEAAYWFQAELKGTSLESRIGEIVKTIREAPGTVAMWKVQTNLREVMQRSAADVPAARANMAELAAIAKAHPGTVAAQDAVNGVRFWETMIAGGNLPDPSKEGGKEKKAAGDDAEKD